MTKLNNFQSNSKDLDKNRILDLLNQLNSKLQYKNLNSELYLVGGAVMCLALDARTSTRDLDGIFEPKQEVYECVKLIAKDNDLEDDWLNDAVKGFLSEKSEFQVFLKLSNLVVKVTTPEYLFAMKVQSSRTDRSSEIDDIKFLIKLLRVRTIKDAESIVTKFYRIELIPNKSWYLLEELIEDETI